MIPLWLEHSGSYAFRRPIRLDYTALPTVIAITGPNGAGKTTLLDLPFAATHLTMPFRPKPLHREFAARGFIRMAWESSGQRYRSEVRVDPGAGRTEADLFEEPRPVDGPGHLAGPKSSEYLAEVLRRWAPLDLLLASMYAVQPVEGKDTGAFHGLSKADRRGLMIDLIGLDVFPPRQERADARVDTVEKDLAAVRARTADVAPRAARRAELEAHRASTMAALDTARERLADLDGDLEQLRQALATARADRARVDVPAGRLEELETAVAAIDATLTALRERVANNRRLLERGDSIRTACERDTALRAELAALGPVLQQAEASLRADADAGARELQDVTGDLDRQESVLARATDIESAEARATEVRGLVAALDEESTALAPMLHEAAGLSARIDDLERSLGEDEREVASIRNFFGRAEELTLAADRHGVLGRRIAAVETEIDAARLAHRAALDTFAGAEDLRRRAGEAEHRRRVLTEDAQLATEVPCGGAGAYAACRFLVRVAAAREEGPALDEEMAGLSRQLQDMPAEAPVDPSPGLELQRRGLAAERERLAPLANEATLIEPQRLALGRVTARITQTRAALEEALRARAATATATTRAEAIATERAGLTGELQRLAPVLDLSRDLHAARAGIGRLRELRDHARERLDVALAKLSARAAAARRQPEIEEEVRGLAETVKRKSYLDVAETRISELTAQIDETETSRAGRAQDRDTVADAVASATRLDDEIRTLLRRQADVETPRPSYVTQVTAGERALGACESQLADAVAAETQAADLAKQERALVTDLADWALIAKACSPVGIPALKIDGALPEIGRLATELIRESLGSSSFTVRLVTQRQDAKGTRMLEDLDWQILRGGEVIAPEDLSGGEHVFPRETIAVAMALYNATRSGRRIGCLFRDEVTAALREDNARLYVTMLRKAAQLGGFRHVFFVTHSPRAAELADATLTVSDGEITVR